MIEFVYSTVPGKIEQFFTKIKQVGKPEQATNKWITMIGFKSSNDRSLIRVLQFLGFIDANHRPTEIWRNYRNSDHSKVLAKAIISSYGDLYKLYPNAHEKNSEDLSNYFRGLTNASEQVISKAVSTFSSLCELADFSYEKGVEKLKSSTRKEEHIEDEIPRQPHSETIRSFSFDPSVHIDIQIHISPDSNSDQIDAIFKSMSKHLYNRDNGK